MLVDVDTFGSIEMDHLVPESIGGTRSQDNVVTSCNVCNRLKGRYCPEGHESMSRNEIINECRKYVFLRRAEYTKLLVDAVTEYRKKDT